MLAAVFPVSKDDSEDEVEVTEGFYNRTVGDRRKCKEVDKKGKGKAEDEEDEEANIAGPSSAPLRRYASDRAVFITACEELKVVIQKDGRLFDEEERKSVRQLQKAIQGHLVCN